MKHLIHQLSKFASVGIVATAVHALVYTVAGGLLEPMLANLIAFIIAFLFSYSGHFLWTFRAQTQGQKVHKAFAYQLRFLIVALSGLLLNSLGVWVVTEWLLIDYLFALAPMIFVVPLATFFLAKRWAIKLASPLLYSITSLILFSIGQRLHSTRAGLYAGLLFLTMPLVSFNSLFITTDAPLLFFWTLALLLFLKAQQSNQWVVWIAAGIVGGLGLLSKYTFILFPAGFLVYAAISKEGRELLANPRFWVACGIAILLLLPNLWWNYQHNFISFQHTAEIAQQAENEPKLSRLLEFFAMQFLVFGPLTALIILATLRNALSSENSKLLWSIFIPIFIVISVQALTARANINWGAPAYITGSLIVAIWLAQRDSNRLIKLAVSVNLVLAILFYHYSTFQKVAGVEPTKNNNPYTRISGWYELGQSIQPYLDQYPEAPIASESRKVLAYFGYYREPMDLFGRALTFDDHTISQYELLYPIDTSPASEHLVVSEHLTEIQLASYFQSAKTLTSQSVKVTKDLTRTIHVTLVSGWLGK